MCLFFRSCIALALFSFAASAQEADLKSLLARKFLPAGLTQTEMEKFLEARIPRLKTFNDAASWEQEAQRLRAEVLAKVVYRGEAAAWRDAKLKVEWLETLPGGQGYRLKQVRFEALPGLWIPALLYEPEKIQGKVPATLNVMGHDPVGKDVAYQQIRCINLAKRGMLALNVEWFNFGQLRGDNYHHGRMNQLDLCGTSGLGPFYLALKRGLDVLLSHPNADPERVAVSGLSGGGWQTIYISALDTRVTLSNPVAGYSSFLTRIKHHKDLGDSEQTPCDMATVADYIHLTAMMAPRPTLLTYNSRDNCCFESGYALPPLLESAGPFFKLHGKTTALRGHVNDDPGTHNFDKDNREAFYRMIGDFFFPGQKDYQREEIPCDKELKSKDELRVPLPMPNADFNSLALALAKKLPREAEWPAEKDQVKAWKEKARLRLASVVKPKGVYQLKFREPRKKAISAQGHYLQHGFVDTKELTMPVVRIFKSKLYGSTATLLHDNGIAESAGLIEKLLQETRNVQVIDPLFFGQSRLPQREYLFALLMGSVGERPLGIQSAQLKAAKGERLVAHGPRASLVALVTAALNPNWFGTVELHDSLASLKEVIEQNKHYQQWPEVFCFGLLEEFDIRQLAFLAADENCPVRFSNGGDRHRRELGDLRGWNIVVKEGNN